MSKRNRKKKPGSRRDLAEKEKEQHTIEETEDHALSKLRTRLDEKQKNRIYDLMDKVTESIQKGKPMHHIIFEKAVYEIVPSKPRDYHFAEQIVKTFNEQGRWTDVHAHMKKSGMNL